MRVFLDTNIIIDFYAAREQYYRPAAVLIDLAERKEIEIAVSATTFVNAFYLLRRQFNSAELYRSMRALADLCVITPIDKVIIEKALSLDWIDFEDCAQTISAESVKADVIITRNVKDFQGSHLLVKTPIDFLNEYFSN